MSYNVTIRESSFELSKRDILRYKEVSNSIPLDEVTKDGEFIITNPVAYVILDIHNPKAKDNADYSKIIVIDAAGNSYITGSDNFTRAFLDIFNTMGEEEYAISCQQRASSNYKDKTFLTCSIL